MSAVIATYTEDGQVYEVSHLGLVLASHWGHFTVSRDGRQVAGFAIGGDAGRPESSPGDQIPPGRPQTRGTAPAARELPVTDAELIGLARHAVAAGALLPGQTPPGMRSWPRCRTCGDLIQLSTGRCVRCDFPPEPRWTFGTPP